MRWGALAPLFVSLPILNLGIVEYVQRTKSVSGTIQFEETNVNDTNEEMDHLANGSSNVFER